MPSSIKLVSAKFNLNILLSKQRDIVSHALAQAAQNAASIAKQLAPVRTGALRDSIFVEQSGQMAFRVGAGIDYARFVEEGTVYQDAQPFLRPAVQAVQRDIQSALKR